MDLSLIEMDHLPSRPLAESEPDSKETERLLEEVPEEQLEPEKLRAGTNTCTASWDGGDSTEGSVAVKSIPNATSLLAGQKHEDGRLILLLSRFYRWKSRDGERERVTPFAVVLLLVLLAVYVLNQADRLVLPVVIPNGLRCDVGKQDCSNNSGGAANATLNGSSSDSDCIRFNDDQQGLLTGLLCSTEHVLQLEKNPDSC